jgi:hypothetical protein
LRAFSSAGGSST